MKTKYFVLFFAFFANSLFVVAQNNDQTDKRVAEIKNLYQKIVSGKQNYHTIKVESDLYEGTAASIQFFDDENKLKLVIVSTGGEFGYDFFEYYFEDSKLFFLFSRTVAESHWGEQPMTTNLTEHRFYFDSNQQMIKALSKEAKTKSKKSVEQLSAETKNEDIESVSWPIFDREIKKAERLLSLYKNLYSSMYE